MTKEIFGDWNDLALAEGAAVARAQLAAAINTPTPQNVKGGSDKKSAVTAESLTIDACLQRFMWTTPEGRILDKERAQILRPAQLKGWLGKDLFAEWMAHDQRRIMEHYQALQICSASSLQGEGGSDALDKALERFSLLYPSQNGWDRDRHEMVALRDVAALLNETYSQWEKHPRRKVYDFDRVVFDPAQTKSPDDGYLNMFRGMRLKPLHAPDKCMAIRRLVNELVNGDATVFDWLMCWLAYPLQNVGAKMATTILMHSKTQGGGKSLFFESCYKPIFGEYATTVGQTQMESKYTDWRSKKLYVLFEEVLNRGQKYNHIGELKHMISGATMRIEKKFVSGWEEANHMNAVFLSNELQPLYVERTDRRTCVIYPDKKLDPDLKEAVLRELDNDGVAAFYGYLLRWPMQWKGYDGKMHEFNTHTEPPMTEAKKAIISYGLSGFELFSDMWKRGDLENYPFESVSVNHLYQAYREWCSAYNERSVSLNKFSLHLSKEFKKQKDVWFVQGINRRKTAFFMVSQPPSDQNREDWLGKIYGRWDQKFNAYGVAS